MPNMSYCRFHNTNLDLLDCLGALEEEETLSQDEFLSCQNLFRNFINFCCEEGIIEDDEVDERLEEFFQNRINVES